MAKCLACGEPVILARTEAGRWQPLNAAPDPAGNVLAYETGPGNWLARSCKPGTLAVYPDRVYKPHQATCQGTPQAAPERPVSVPAGVTSLQAWRDAAAAHKKASRRRRASRAAPRIAGFRVGPGGRT